ncbi:MAG TPA: endoflagellar protein [Deltaproteobacteria bacterium]|nr:endoflagellar protein [Deltaproteobacteria bacterium]HCP46257.1 endoflagellar protein [Deltaproteobacteria bacterium]
MIQLTRFNNETITVNVELVLRVEANPDTTLHMTNGDIVKVRETPQEVVDRTIAYKQQVFALHIDPRKAP